MTGLIIRFRKGFCFDTSCLAAEGKFGGFWQLLCDRLTNLLLKSITVHTFTKLYLAVRASSMLYSVTHDCIMPMVTIK